MELTRAFYQDPEAYHRHVYPFNHQPSSFAFDQLLQELGHAEGSSAQ